jgi:nucleotide-binding universal stress UspA family protein
MPKATPKSQPRHILLATDLSAAGDRAFDRAVLLAKQWNAALALCHVVEASSSHPIGIERRIRNVEAEMAELEQRGRAALKQIVSRHILIGDPGDRVVAHALQIKSDFVVTGPAHSRIPGEKLLGSTAARILRNAHVPVLAVRRRALDPYKHVAVSVDFSTVSRDAIDAARAMFPAATVTLVHALEVDPDWSEPDPRKSINDVETAERAKAKRLAEQEMASLIGTAAGKVQPVIVEGRPGAVVGSYVEKERPDVVVTGTYGMTGARAGEIGSTAEMLLTTLPCDVLAVRPRS